MGAEQSERVYISKLIEQKTATYASSLLFCIKKLCLILKSMEVYMSSAKRLYFKQQAEERLGEVSYNRYGSKMTIIKYNNFKDVTVRFDDNYTVTAQYRNFKEGRIANPYDKSVCGVGYLGEGKYRAQVNRVQQKVYTTWKSIITRCYRDRGECYKGCIVCDEWHNYQNFAKWYKENYYYVEGRRMEVDKDLLHKGNKIYSPETCVIIPDDINIAIVKNERARGNLPMGVMQRKPTHSYCADINMYGKHAHLGRYDTPEEAFKVYKGYKENYIKEIANKYKGIIPDKVYGALINYRVDIDD